MAHGWLMLAHLPHRNLINARDAGRDWMSWAEDGHRTTRPAAVMTAADHGSYQVGSHRRFQATLINGATSFLPWVARVHQTIP